MLASSLSHRDLFTSLPPPHCAWLSPWARRLSDPLQIISGLNQPSRNWPALLPEVAPTHYLVSSCVHWKPNQAQLATKTVCVVGQNYGSLKCNGGQQIATKAIKMYVSYFKNNYSDVSIGESENTASSVTHFLSFVFRWV